MEVGKKYFEQLIDEMKEARKVKLDTELTADDLKELAEKFKAEYKEKLGEDFPQDPKVQLMGAIKAVFRSWDNPRAIYYRRMELTDELLENLKKFLPGSAAIYRINGDIVETLYAAENLCALNGMTAEEYRALTSRNAAATVLPADLPGLMRETDSRSSAACLTEGSIPKDEPITNAAADFPLPLTAASRPASSSEERSRPSGVNTHSHAPFGTCSWMAAASRESPCAISAGEGFSGSRDSGSSTSLKSANARSRLAYSSAAAR